MNKKGFTLTELLTVIVILAIIALIAIPIVLGVIESSRERLHDEQVDRIKSAARNWSTTSLLRPVECVSISELIAAGFLEQDGDSPNSIANPKGGRFTGIVHLRWDTDINQYEYTFPAPASINPPCP